MKVRALAASLAVLLAAEPALADETPSPMAIDAEGARGLRFAGGIALAGGGFLGLLLGGVFGVRTFVDKGAIGSHCTPSGRCDVTGYVIGSEARDFALISTVTFTIGIAAATAGTILIVRNAPKKPANAAWIAPGPGGVRVGVAF